MIGHRAAAHREIAQVAVGPQAPRRGPDRDPRLEEPHAFALDGHRAAARRQGRLADVILAVRIGVGETERAKVLNMEIAT